MDNNTTNKSRNRKVLIIEDEHFITELYQRSLSKAGYQVSVVIDGNEALQKSQTDQYDIILLDLMIPNLTGIEILNILRDKNNKNQIKAKIIVTTNLEQRSEVKRSIEEKADAYLIKAELTPDELVDFLDNVK